MSERILSEFSSFESAELAARRILGQADTITRISIYPRRETPTSSVKRPEILPTTAGLGLPTRTEMDEDYGYYEPVQAQDMLLVADMEESDARNAARILRNAGGIKINSITL